MRRWKDRLATLFLVLALGLSLLPWVYEARPVKASLEVCDEYQEEFQECWGHPVNCFCPIIIDG